MDQGYYWVLDGVKWLVAYFDGKSTWYLAGSTVGFAARDFDEIKTDPIEEPED